MDGTQDGRRGPGWSRTLPSHGDRAARRRHDRPASRTDTVAQERRLVTEVPGPRSRELAARRAGAVTSAVSSVLPVYVERAGGGVVVDVDGNSFIDLGSGHRRHQRRQLRARGRRRGAGAGGRLHPHLLHGRAVRGVRRRLRGAGPADPGDHEKRSALFNSGAEAVENAVKVARLATGRQAVIVFDHAYHGRTNLTMALTAKNMPYKNGFGPFAGEVYRVPMSYPFRDEPGLTGEQAAARAIAMIETQVGAAQRRRRAHRADPGRGRLRRPGAGLPAGAGRVVPRRGCRLHRRRDPDRLLPDRAVVRLRCTRASCRT